MNVSCKQNDAGGTVMITQKIEEENKSSVPVRGEVHCPHCGAMLAEEEIIPAVFVSRGKEYRWNTCNRCGGIVPSAETSAPSDRKSKAGKTSAA